MAVEMVELVNPANGQTFKVTARQAAGVYADFASPEAAAEPKPKKTTRKRSAKKSATIKDD
jgi:hypothetical protein